MKIIKKSLKKKIISDKDEEMVSEQDLDQLGLPFQSSPGEISEVMRQLVQNANLTSVASPVALIFGKEGIKNSWSRLSNEVHEKGSSVAQPLPNINATNEDENEDDQELVSQMSDNTRKKKNL